MAKLAGRRGHARVVVMSIIDAEIKAVREVFGATAEIGVTGDYTLPEFASRKGEERQYPFVVTRSNDRSNTPATLSTQARLEWYRPEVVLVVGIGGGIQRGANPPQGPGLGDVVIGRYVHYADYTKNLPGHSYLRYISIDQPSAQLVGQHADTLALQAPADCLLAAGHSEARRNGERAPDPRKRACRCRVDCRKPHGRKADRDAGSV